MPSTKSSKAGLKIAIVIPALNEEKHLEPLLKSITSEKYANKEIIIVDGGSTDRTLEIAKKYGAKTVLETGDKSPANARNMGAAATDAELISFFDADKHSINDTYFQEMVKHFWDKEVIGVRGRVGYYPFHSKVEEMNVKSMYFTHDPPQGPRLNVFVTPGLIRRSVFLEIGPFLNIGLGEDTDLNMKLGEYARKNGKRIDYEQSSLCLDHSPETLQEYAKSRKWYGRTFVQYLRTSKNLNPRLIAYACYPVFLPYFLYLVVRRFDASYIPAYFFGLLGWLYFLKGLILG
jgi:glycosyltransferase involved in cell wall biosynthesis